MSYQGNVLHWIEERCSVFRVTNRALKRLTLVSALVLSQLSPLQPHDAAIAAQIRFVDTIHDKAVTLLNAAIEVMKDQGEDAGVAGMQEAAQETRHWLNMTGFSTRTTNARIDAIIATCVNTPFGTCDPLRIRAATLDLLLLLEIGSAPTPLHHANEARLRGFRALEAITRSAENAPSDETHWKGFRSLSAAASKAAEADEAFSVAIDAFESQQQKPGFKGWNRGEFQTLLSSISHAAEAAYLSGNCGRAVAHADQLIRLAEDMPQQWQLDYPPIAHALTIKAQCQIWFRMPLDAYRFAKKAIDLEASVASDRKSGIESLEIRARFRASAQLKTDPREAGAMAALLLLHAPKAAADASVPTETELIDNIVKWTSTRRASALSDAILLSALANDGQVAQRSAVEALIAANTDVDLARRALASNRAGGAKQLENAAETLRRAADAARNAGVTLPETDAKLFEIADVLRVGEGFLYLYRSQFGPILWGLSADKNVIVAPPTMSQSLLYFPEKNPTILSPQVVLTLVAPALELSRPSMGWIVGGVNWFLSRPRSLKDDDLLANALKGAATEFGPSLDSIKGFARYWTVAYNEELDGFPLAELPLISDRQLADIRSRDVFHAPDKDPPPPKFETERSFGYEFAYAVVPSPRALVVLRTHRKDSALKSPVSYLGVGNVPFRYEPCSSLADASATALDARRNLSDAILNRACLAESSAQLEALRPGNEGTLLAGKEAREAALHAFRDRPIKRLVFSTHGVEPGASVTGGWPALLLYPPLKISTPRDDGILTPLEVADLKLHAELVALSACSTGVEDRALGEEPLTGMAFGFFLGGARSVVLTRWQLRVDIGLAFNREFGSALDRGLTRAEAMRDARRRLIAMPGVKPWQWGVFELLGEAGPMQ